MNCSICNSITIARQITVRSGKVMNINHCGKCHFDFFDHDPTALLASDKLDESRLRAAGLDIPSIELDFENGIKQSQPYLEKFFEESDKGSNVLEIGCSWGYFLKLLRDKGVNPYGIELNITRTRYVNEFLSIPCFETLEACENSGLKFKKIYMFYVLEYIPNPLEYFTRLISLLEDGGSIILNSPNLNDVLKNIWQSDGFINFFYDECAINYFTIDAMRVFAKKLPVKDFKLYSKQGYSFLNHASWFITNKPRTTGIVGGDNFINDVLARFNSSNTPFKHDFIAFFQKFDIEYKKLIENNEYGNQIYLILNK